MGYCPNTPEDIREMLSVIGAGSVEELFTTIPAELRAKSFELPAGVSEFELMGIMRSKAAAGGTGITPFIGGGLYDHIIPAAVDHLSSRAEFYTAYTPYQPECSQGTLQALFEYQTAICRLTGMEASNASLYDGGTAVAEAALMALRITGRSAVVLDASVNPLHREVVCGYLAGLSAHVAEVAPSGCGSDLDRLVASITDETAAVIVQNPNFFGSVEDFSTLAAKAHERGALLIESCYPIALGLLILATAAFYIPIRIDHPIWMATFLLLTAASFSLFGFIIGIWARSFEQLQFIPMLVITPLSFLGGAFYSIDMLPPAWRTLTLFNPVVYLISGFRWSFYGSADVAVGWSIGAIFGFLAAGMGVVTWIFRTGYRLKS